MKALALLLLVTCAASAQPTAPELTLNGSSTTRFEFAKLPELALVRGVPQVVQLGFYQLDPENRWPPGDLERASGWQSTRPTRLVEAASGLPVVSNIVDYNGLTGELTYAGTWSGDVTVRLQEVGGTAQSESFRIRVLTPTSVYGENAAAVNQAKGWNAKVCPSPAMTFVACRNQFTGGASDVAPTVVFITPGLYVDQDWFLTNRRYIYVLGDPANRPTLVGDALSGAYKAMMYIANLNLKNTNMAMAGALAGYPNITVIRNVYQCCETAQQNGFVNPNTHAADRWEVYWHASESVGMGGTGNTTHPAYVEGRPNSMLDVNNLRLLGSRGSSGIKTVMGELNVRHSMVHVAEDPAEIANGTCAASGYSTGCLMHTPVDFPGYTTAIIYGNQFEVWRGPTVGVPVGRSGILAGTIFVRLRAPTHGSDIPNYPNVSWTPPVSSQATKQSPCRDWSPRADSFVSDAFWTDVRSVDLDDGSNPCTFKHYVSYNHFVQLPGSLPVTVLRDDGTYPARVKAQFSAWHIAERNHPLWAERSTNFLFANTYDGFGEQQKYKLDFTPPIYAVEPGAQWPRSEPTDWPRVVEIEEELPPWFKL